MSRTYLQQSISTRKVFEDGHLRSWKHFFCERLQFRGLGRVEFEEHDARQGMEVVGDLLEKSFDEFRPFRSGKERERGLVVDDIASQARLVAIREVGEVGDEDERSR